MKQWPRRMTRTCADGTLVAFAQVDGPDDVWLWAVVTDFRGPQDYDQLLMGFFEGCEPSEEHVKKLLTMVTA